MVTGKSVSQGARISPRMLRWSALVGGLLPLAHLAFRAQIGDLGVDPVETLTHVTGQSALILLLISLALTPARMYLGWNRLIVVRRTVGLLAFLYAGLHFAVFVVLDQSLSWKFIAGEIAERRWITFGFAALVLLVPLAVTSTNGMVRRLGAVHWRWLHRLVYASGVLAVLHYTWAVKADTRRPFAYGVVLAVLLAARVIHGRRRIR